MSPIEPRGGPPPPEDGPQRTRRVELRRKVSLKFKEFQGFVNEYSENVSAGGMFIRTTSPQAPGTVFDFELTLGDDYKLIHGIAEVVWVRERDEGFDEPAGMGVRFLNLDADSRKLIDRMVAERLDRDARKAAAVAPPVPRAGEPWREPSAVAPPPPSPSWSEAPPPLESDAEPVPEEPAAAAAPPGHLDLAAGSAAAGAAAAAEAPEPPRPPESSGPQEPPSAPRLPGPSPYAYARSYGGTAVARRPRRSRPLLVVLLVLAALVAALAAFFLLFPETAMRWLVGDDGEDDAVLVELPRSRPEEGAGDLGPVEPVPRREAEGVLGPVVPPPGDETAAAQEPEPEAGVPEAAPEAGEPAAPAGPEAAPEPTPGAEGPAGFSRVLNIVWEERAGELVVTIHLDGTIEEWNYSIARIETPPARELVRIEGVRQPFPRSTIPVDAGGLETIRVGFHPEARGSQLHVVLDLADPEAGIDRSEAAGSELRLFVTRGEE